MTNCLPFVAADSLCLLQVGGAQAQFLVLIANSAFGKVCTIATGAYYARGGRTDSHDPGTWSGSEPLKVS